MADFLQADKYTDANEGGYCNVPGDDGGETYAGLTRRDNPEPAIWAIIDSHKPLKWNQVIKDPVLDGLLNDLFKRKYWDHIQGDAITNQALATYLYDWYINSGTVAVKKLQEVLFIEEDGIIGPGTLEAINNQKPESGLLLRYYMRRCRWYRDHVVAVPAHEKFLIGWLDRARRLYNELSK